MKTRNIFLVMICAALFALCASVGFANPLPTYQEVRLSYVKSDSLLLDRHGEILHELRTDRDRRRLDWTPLRNISPALKEAVVQAEDRRFYEHSGLDYRGIGAAVLQGLTSSGVRGASTITMQLAALLDRELRNGKGRKSFWQKGKQALASLQMERIWSKEEILEAYLNLVSFRGELQGIAAASRGLMGKDPHGLDRAESLILASLIRSPRASSVEVVKRATSLGEFLKWPTDGPEIVLKVRQIFTGTDILRPQMALAPHIARRLLLDRPDGSTVICTLDGEIQRFALDRLLHHLLPLRSQNVRDGAVLIVENRTGEVLAYASDGGEAAFGQLVDGVQAKRQAGSTLKPFLYALAFDERILTPASLLDDSPLDVAVFGGLYHPRNYEGRFRGPVPVRVALASSLNVPAVRALSLVGTEAFLNRLRSLGLKGINESGDFYGPALALGSADVSLWELVNAYCTLANGGEWRELGLTFEKAPRSPRKKVFSPQAAFMISDILSDREARSTTFGLENPLATRFWAAAKTGTSKDMRDNWCIGYSPKYTVGVWVGNFSGEPMWNVSGISGSALIWSEIMNRLHRDDRPAPRQPPPGLVRAHAGNSSGMETGGGEWFIQGTEPVAGEEKVPSFSQRILYPPTGTVIALDPDIPADRQKVFLVMQNSQKTMNWVLNGKELRSSGKATPWSPRPGKYHLVLKDEEIGVADSVHFEVRGAAFEGDQKENEDFELWE